MAVGVERNLRPGSSDTQALLAHTYLHTCSIFPKRFMGYGHTDADPQCTFARDINIGTYLTLFVTSSELHTIYYV